MLTKTKNDGRPMNEIVETMILFGRAEREQMLKFYEETMPKEIGPARREMGVLSVRWMVERRMEENKEMMKEEAMRDGIKRGVTREGSGPDEKFDFGKHTGRTFREVYLVDPTVVGR